MCMRINSMQYAERSVKCVIRTALRQFSCYRAEISVEARTVGEALDKVTGEHAELRRHLYGEHGALRNFVNVYVNDQDIRAAQRLETPLKEGDTISIVPAIAGGAAAEEKAQGASAVKAEAGSAVKADAASLPQLSNEEIARYSRHLIMPEVGVEGQRRLKAARVLMIGTGGLGAPTGMYLAAAGVGTLGVVDFDVVDASNLQRQSG